MVLNTLAHVTETSGDGRVLAMIDPAQPAPSEHKINEALDLLSSHRHAMQPGQLYDLVAEVRAYITALRAEYARGYNAMQGDLEQHDAQVRQECAEKMRGLYPEPGEGSVAFIDRIIAAILGKNSEA